MWRLPDKVYTTYKRRCKELKREPIERKQFKDLFSRQRRYLSRLIDMYPGKSPYLTMDIDGKMTLFAGVEQGQIQVRVLTQVEHDAFMAQKKGVPHDPRRGSAGPGPTP